MTPLPAFVIVSCSHTEFFPPAFVPPPIPVLCQVLENPCSVGFKSDVYSFGIVVWEVLSGQVHEIPGSHPRRHINSQAIGINVLIRRSRREIHE